MRVLLPGRAAVVEDWEQLDTKGGVLTHYRLALCEGPKPMVFVCRENGRPRRSRQPRNLGFFSFEPDIVDGIAEDIEQVLHGEAKQLMTFDKLSLLHQITQRIDRELESYSQRMDRAIRLAQKRPESLTPERFERIVTLAVEKMERLKKAPLEALSAIGRSRR